MKIADKFTNERDPEEVPVEWYLERFRNWREIELAKTDWTQLSDAPCDANDFAEYRQALRDLPGAKDFANAILPVHP